MLSLALLAASAPLPPPLTAEQGRQLRCVAVLAVLAGAQERQAPAALTLPPLAERGARFAQSVGNAIVTESGRTQEQVRDALVAQAAAVQGKAGADAAALVPEGRQCVALMEQTVPAEPPPIPADNSAEAPRR